jgi:hypothetical protein
MKPNEAAFPLKNELLGSGLTKREYFATMAMQGILASDGRNGMLNFDAENISNWSVIQADSLIQELNKELK